MIKNLVIVIPMELNPAFGCFYPKCIDLDRNLDRQLWMDE